MDKIDYNDAVITNDNSDSEMILLKNLVDKINEIIEWINSQ